MNTRLDLPFEWLSSQFDVERLGWVLVHSLWQFTVVALLAGTLVRALRGQASGLRYGVLVTAMAVAAAAPAATWMLLPGEMLLPTTSRVRDIPAPRAEVAVDLVGDASPIERETAVAELPLLTVDHAGSEPRRAELRTTPATAQPELSWRERGRTALQPWLAWIVAIWSVGVVIGSVRPLMGWQMLWRLRRVGVSPVPDEVLAAMRRVSKRMGLTNVVELLQSSLTHVPIVVGYFRPVILLPVSLVTSIPTAQLEAILAHELTHVRRHDFVVNLLQTVVETLFFYHPAMWWLSSQIRVEREHCCDDFVVHLLGNRVEYGRALVAVEQLRGRSSALALSAGGGSLLSRIRRLTVGPVAASNRAAWCGSIAAILACFIGCSVLVSSTLTPPRSELIAANESDLAADAFKAGQEEARQDIAKGQLKYKLYGKQADKDRVLSDALKADVTIQFERLGGDEIANDVKRRADGYNLIIFDHLIVKRIEASGPAGLVREAQRKAVELAIRAAAEGQPARENPVSNDAKEKPEAVRRPARASLVLPDHLNVMAVGLDRGSKELVSVATERDVAVRAWDLAEKKLKREVKLQSEKHGNFFLQSHLTLSGDRQRVVAVLDGKPTIWDATTGKLVKTLELPREMQNGMLHGLTVTPDLSLVACGRMAGISGFDVSDAYAIVWDVATGRVLRTLTHANALQIQSLALSPDGKCLATGGQQAGMCVFDVGTGNLLHQFANDNPGQKHPDPEVSAGGASQVLSLQFSPDGQRLALGDLLGVKMVETKTGKLLFQCNAPYRYGRSGLVFSKDGQLLARVGTDKTVPIWSAVSGTLLVELPTETNAGAFSEDGRSFAVGFSDEKQGLAVWSLSGDVAPTDAKFQGASLPEAPSGEWGAPAGGLRARVVPVLSSMSDDAIDTTRRVSKFAKAADVAFVVELENVSDKPISLVDLWHDPQTGKPIQDADCLSQLVCSVVLFDQDGKSLEQAEVEVGDPEFALHEARVAALQPGKTLQFLIKPARWLPAFQPQIQAGSYRVAVRYHWLTGQSAARVSAANPRRSLQEAAVVQVASAPVAIEVGGERRIADLTWGSANNGLRAAVSLAPSQGTFSHGDKVAVRLHLQNVSTQPIKLVTDLSLPTAKATIIDAMGRPVALEESGGGLSPQLRGVVTLKPQQIVELDVGDLGLAISDEQADQLDETILRKLVAPTGKYGMQWEIVFDNSLTQRVFKQGQEIVRVKDAWVGKLKTGVTPLLIATAPVAGLEFLKPYPKLHGLSLDMTEPQFLDIVKRQELKTRKTVDGENVSHFIGFGDGLTLIVMFGPEGNCRGIQRIRGNEKE